MDVDLSASIRILHEPTQFYSFIREEIKRAKYRIVLSALYLGTSALESAIIEDIQNALRKEDKLQVTILLDFSRAQRRKQSSIDILQPLLTSFPSRCNCFLYQPPQLRRFPWRLIPSPFIETLGVYHCKFLIFDSNVLLTGANLSEEYFRNRQDRYMSISGCEPLLQFLNEMTDIIQDHSYLITTSGAALPPDIVDNEIFRSQIDDLLHKTSWNPFHDTMNSNRIATPYLCKMLTYPDDFVAELSFSNDSSSNSFLVPIVQMGSAGVNYESLFLPALLRSPSRWRSILLSSPYASIPFSLAFALRDALQCSIVSNLPKVSDTYKITDGDDPQDEDTVMPSSVPHLCILTPSINAHGFAAASGVRAVVPKLHEAALDESLSLPWATTASTMLKYCRRHWTFHAKGLWLSRPIGDDEKPNRRPLDGTTDEEPSEVHLSYIGSSNMSERSWERDFELGFLLVTRDVSLQRQLQREQTRLLKHAVKQSSLEPLKKLSLSVRLLMKITKYLKIL